jgi:hypothetical protein
LSSGKLAATKDGERRWGWKVINGLIVSFERKTHVIFGFLWILCDFPNSDCGFWLWDFVDFNSSNFILKGCENQWTFYEKLHVNRLKIHKTKTCSSTTKLNCENAKNRMTLNFPDSADFMIPNHFFCLVSRVDIKINYRASLSHLWTLLFEKLIFCFKTTKKSNLNRKSSVSSNLEWSKYLNTVRQRSELFGTNFNFDHRYWYLIFAR